MAKSLFWIIVFLMPILSVSPLQVFIYKSLYYGFVYYALIAALLLAALLRKDRIAMDNSIKFLGAFWGISLLSLLIGSGLRVGGIDSAAGYGTFALVYLFFNIATIYLVIGFIRSKVDIERFVNILFIASALTSLWGILMVVLHLAGILSPSVLPVNLFPRLTGSATEPQVYGNFLLSVIFLNMSYVFVNKRPIYIFALFINLLALVMTFSMGAWLAFFSAFIFYIMFSLKYLDKYAHLKIIGGFLAVLFCLGFIQYFNGSYLQDYGRYLSKVKIWRVGSELREYKQDIKGQDPEEYRSHLVEKHDDKMVRLWMAQTAVNMFVKNPILGIGPGNYRFVYNDYKPAATPKRDYERAHNAFLEVLAETGILGFTAFIGVLIYIFFRSIRARQKLMDARSILLYNAMIFGFVSLLIHGLSFGILAHNYTWMSLGLLLAAIKILENNESIT